MTTLFTIGHSNHEIGKFMDLLKKHGIAQLVDIRSAPYSRFNPHFNLKVLENSLQLQGITYTFAGEKLGGRPKDPSCYRHQTIPKKGADFLNEIDYSEVMKKAFFLEGIQQLMELSSVVSTVIMCSEENPAGCHRHHLIACYLLATHPEVTIQHIRGDGHVEDARSMIVPRLFS